MTRAGFANWTKATPEVRLLPSHRREREGHCLPWFSLFKRMTPRSMGHNANKKPI